MINPLIDKTDRNCVGLNSIMQSQSPFFYKDNNGKFVFVNESLARFLNLKPIDMIGKCLEDLIEEKLIPEEIARKYIEEDGFLYRGEFREKSYETVVGENPYLVKKIAISDLEGKIRGIVGVAIDITDIKETLEAEKRANMLKEEFLKNMSHDLRTPLNGIKGSAELIKHLIESGKYTESMILDYLNEIISTSDNMSRLLSEISDLSLIETGNYNLSITHIDFLKFLKDKTSKYENNSNNISIDLRESILIPTIIDSDYVVLDRIFDNIVENAVKYGNFGGNVVVKPFYEPKKDSLTVMVRNTGSYIPENKIENILRKYERDAFIADPNSVNNGLGSYLTNKMLELIGGEINIRSYNWRDGRTSVFVTIPNVTRKYSANIAK